jgi:polysaccharide export outer membrane protein
VEIRVHGQPELTGEYVISPTGTINFPLLGELEIAGQRCDEVERTLTQKLGEKHLRDPYVVCINREARRTAVTVDGQVRSPGIVEFRKGLMLTDAIAQCEGLAERAKGNAVVITRKNADGSTRSVVVPYEDIVTAQAGNICLHPGDLIYVPERVF